MTYRYIHTHNIHNYRHFLVCIIYVGLQLAPIIICVVSKEALTTSDSFFQLVLKRITTNVRLCNVINKIMKVLKCRTLASL